ncbi:MAG: SoxR reducing system RseC family protein [Bacteroidales bacterium]|nr:SoxR reducing system RseC family protein [Bacteroidales bacterium]
MKKEEISHIGKVVSVTPLTTAVKIISESACASCHAAGLCGMGEYKEKVIEVPTSPGSRHEEGDEVTLVLKATMGLKAVWLSYVIPVIILMAVILLLGASGVPELVSGLAAIAGVAVYYFGLWLFRDRLKDEYVFTIK